MALKLSNLKKSYKQGDTEVSVLKGLNGEIQDGEVVAVIGPSGCGKSTLLTLLAGLDIPTQGSIFIKGQDIATMDEVNLTRFRGKNIGIVFQQFHLLPHLTALENVMVPLEILGIPDQEQRAKELLQEMGLGHRLHHLPGAMSGGECQRVAIARALVTGPSILLADEPSGNLDTATGDKVIDVLFESIRKHKITTILVTHSPELAARCDRRLELKNGLM